MRFVVSFLDPTSCPWICSQKSMKLTEKAPQWTFKKTYLVAFLGTNDATQTTQNVVEVTQMLLLCTESTTTILLPYSPQPPHLWVYNHHTSPLRSPQPPHFSTTDSTPIYFCPIPVNRCSVPVVPIFQYFSCSWTSVSVFQLLFHALFQCSNSSNCSMQCSSCSSYSCMCSSVPVACSSSSSRSNCSSCSMQCSSCSMQCSSVPFVPCSVPVVPCNVPVFQCGSCWTVALWHVCIWVSSM